MGRLFENSKPISAGARSSTLLSMGALTKKRQSLIAYDPSINYQKVCNVGVLQMLTKHKTTVRYAAAAVALVGVGIWGTMSFKGKGDEKRQK